MKKSFLAFVSLLSAGILNAQTIAGDWQGVLDVQVMKLPLVWHIQQMGDSLKATLDSPAQGAKGIPVDAVVFSNHKLEMKMNALRASYTGQLQGDSITGSFSQNGMSFPLVLKKGGIKAPNRPQTPKPPFHYKIEEVSFTNALEGNTLAGSFTTPLDKKMFPVVVMITGSGAQDRDETLFDHKPFWVMADHFTKNGIGVLRLDDRGVGGSSAGKEGATSADFATDISAAVNFLVQKGYKNIGLLGHSEGGLIAPIVAADNKNVKFILSLAGPGIAIDQLMVRQTYDVVRSMGGDETEARKKAELNKKIYDFVKSYQGTELKKDLTPLMTEMMEKTDEFKTLTQQQKQAAIDAQLKTITSPWFQYFLKFDPQVYLTKLKIPVLAINGSKDMQVNAAENLAGWQASLKKAKNKNYKIQELQGLNHLFQEAKTGAVDEYGAIEQTIAPQVLDLITNWILKLK